jgi:heat shock protein HslJ/pimeloyl-ACP methyl ester carboxylesterase
MINRLIFFIAIFISIQSFAQNLRPGFEMAEYIKLLGVSAQFGDSAYSAKIAPPQGFKRIYRSETVGLENQWDLWMSDTGIPIISIRGTTASQTSWLANFYSAMVPAKGALQLTKDYRFEYDLASHPQAAVHIGWLVSTGFLLPGILAKIDSLHSTGKKEFIILGHSQGGAIAYLLTAYLHQLQKQSNKLEGIRFKTYGSAAPKPGNIFFAYEYENMTQGGWAFNVVNSADWVPQTPVSIQTITDFNSINPFKNAKDFIGKSKWPKNWALGYAYGRLNKPSNKAARNYRKYLGKYVSSSVKEILPGYESPEYDNSMNYVRAGQQVVLLADTNYFKKFPQDESKVFVNHFHAPYLYLASRDRIGEVYRNHVLHGNWEVFEISGIGFNDIYSLRKPVINLDTATKKFNGTTSCNSFTGNFTLDNNKIHFPESFAMTKMFCEGGGEKIFLEALNKVDGYKVDGTTVYFLHGEDIIMGLRKKS